MLTLQRMTLKINLYNMDYFVIGLSKKEIKEIIKALRIRAQKLHDLIRDNEELPFPYTSEELKEMADDVRGCHSIILKLEDLIYQ